VARRSRATKLEARGARLKLPAARKPVFAKIGPGLGLGYRRNATAGTWVVRAADGQGGNWTKAIGTADDFAEADGETVLDFWQAQDRARVISRGGRDGDGDEGRPATIAEALDRYEADLKTRGGDTGNVARVRAHLPAVLAGKSVALVTAHDLRAWRDRLAKELAASTVNRTANGLKAALNLIADHDERIPNRRAWENGLASLHDAEGSRNVILPETAVRTIIGKANEHSVEFGLLVEVAAVTGARMSQLARLEVQDLQDGRTDPRLMMPGSRKGRGKKKIARRPVPIPAGLATKLRGIVKDRPLDAALLIKPAPEAQNASGEESAALLPMPWKKSDHSRRFARAVEATGLDPNEVTINALRHSSIVRQLLAGVPLRVVAVNHDTSVVMIERTYSRHIGDHADALARGALLDTTVAPAGNVQPITAAS
jgi:integrase